MQKWKKIVLLLLVLSPSFFFLGKAFADSKAQIEAGTLKLTGPGAFNLALADVDSLVLIDSLPQTAGTGGFSIGLIKKGNFIRKSDGKSIRIVKNAKGPFIYAKAKAGEYYFNLTTTAKTEQLYGQMQFEKDRY